jgi:hypothetical protein
MTDKHYWQGNSLKANFIILRLDSGADLARTRPFLRNVILISSMHFVILPTGERAIDFA